MKLKKFNMKLHTLKPAEGSSKKGKRIARGQGSGRGGTSTRGHKGAQSRSVILERLALKVDKCHYKEEFQSLVLKI